MESMASNVEQRTSGKRARASLLLISCALLCMGAEWVLLVSGTRLHEMILGGAAILLSTLFLSAVYKSEPQRLDFRRADLATGWRIPWYVIRDTYVVTALGAKA